MIAVTLANRFTSEDIYPVVILIANLSHTHQARINLMPIAITAAAVMPALQVLTVLSQYCLQKYGNAGVICMNMGQSLIMTIQYLALKRCGFLDHRATIGLIVATAVTGVVRSALFLFNSPSTPHRI